MTRMDAVLEVAPADRLAVVQPGVVNKSLRDAVAGAGLFYPPDPSSYDWCTIGGNLSTNSGGLCCVKYGVTTDYVLGLEVVLADGRVLRTGRRTVKGVAGYDLARLFVGSEGTLGVITEATLALRPAPQRPVTLAATFATTAQTGQVVERVVTTGLVPSLLEVMDNTCICAVDDLLKADLDRTAHALLVAQSDAGGEAAAAEIAALAELCREAGAEFVHTTDDPAEGDLLLAARRMALPGARAAGQHADRRRRRAAVADRGVPRRLRRHRARARAWSSASSGTPATATCTRRSASTRPTPTSASGPSPRSTTSSSSASPSAARSPASTGSASIKVDWLEREIGPVSLSTCTARSRTRSTRPACSTRARSSGAAAVARPGGRPGAGRHADLPPARAG